MRSEASPLLPIFRSRHQADLLTLLFLHPDEDYTLTDIARRLDVPLSTLHGEVGRLLDAELITVRAVGRSRLLRANLDNRVAEALGRLLAVTFGPQIVVADEFRDIDGIQAVVIFGSWGARHHGQPGPPPNDIDVLVLGEPDRADVYDAADRAQQRLEIPVNPVIRPAARWLADDDPLIQQVKTTPFVITYGSLPVNAK
ncbi:MAG TPA: winged helix-turn-helix domain-containing protein [Streptosporangiaceae bacterium]